jgi:hypothetical protein
MKLRDSVEGHIIKKMKLMRLWITLKLNLFGKKHGLLLLRLLMRIA